MWPFSKKYSIAASVNDTCGISVTFSGNYAKIEAMVNKKDIESVVLNASYILSTVKFNDNIIELMLNEEYFTNKEETYDIFKKDENSDSDTFVQYVEN